MGMRNNRLRIVYRETLCIPQRGRVAAVMHALLPHTGKGRGLRIWLLFQRFAIRAGILETT